MNTKTCIDFANSNVLGFCQAILQPEYDLLAVVKVSTTTFNQVIFTNDPEQERQCRLDVRFKIYNEQ